MARRPQRIEDHGIIGDLHSVALVATDGTIDWYCYPHFDSPSIFGALLDFEIGGHYRIAAAGEPVLKQFYFPDTNVLITRFLSQEGVGQVTDFMPIPREGDGPRQHRIVRRAEAVRGSVHFQLECKPAFDYARARHEAILEPAGVVFRAGATAVGLASPVPLTVDGPAAAAEFVLRRGQSATFILQGLGADEGCGALALDEEGAERAFRETVDFWHAWIRKSRYTGRWREMVHRSALALKLLTFRPTGAIVAAPTTSLPEDLGGVRNWDYRYTWIRDAAFTLYALLRIGFTDEARDFMGWLEARAAHPGSEGLLQPLYGINGETDLREETLDHLRGHAGSRPVRIGNAAANQFQIDIYGALIDGVYLFNKYGTPIGYDLWTRLRRMIDWVCDNWRRPDLGMWEFRSQPHQFVHSKLMCWVAIDRGIRLAMKRSFPADLERWRAERDAIYEDVMELGWSEEKQSFVQAYGSDDLDASNLLMPLVFFMSPRDPRMLGTLDAIQRELAADNLVHRYLTSRTDDGIVGEEGTFSLCTFWYVEALTRAGRIEEARMIFEKMISYANHVGLYAEEIGPRGEALGNFPQAFTHFTLISAAFNLDRYLDRSK